jgi:predicted glycogen debranching enzyme
MIISNGQAYNLSTFEFDGQFHPEGYQYLKTFTRDTGAHFDYEAASIKMTKSVYLARNADVVLIEYDFKKMDSPFEFTIRPFVALRDFHHLQNLDAPLRFYESDDCVFVNYEDDQSVSLLMNCPQAVFEKDPQWWYNFTYRKDRQRCQGSVEDLWAPGFYKYMINGPCKILFKAQAGLDCQTQYLKASSVENITSQLDRAYKEIISASEFEDETQKKLVIAADQFVCRRGEEKKGRTTILAGYPWFFDWGRDAFISLPGLLLATGRYEEARSVLTTFASACDEGMIPNRFDDRSDTAHFNSIDASLWFINAAFEYLKTTDDLQTFDDRLLGVIQEILLRYEKGTKFGIHAESDGLITGGDIHTQLTWMDAKCQGIAFTPRFGKAIETNALWYNALCKTAKYLEDKNPDKANVYSRFAENVAQSFSNTFWNDQTGYLNDCVRPDGIADTSCRCNQILAVSLEYSPLSLAQQKQIVDVVQEKLLTPFGLRTLNQEDSRYRSSYHGDQFNRDSSYHQGTVWPYTIGAFIEAYLKVNNFSCESLSRAGELLKPLIEHITEIGCLGSISEIFDGDRPHIHRGCFAQAWSVAEVLRIYILINAKK